PRLRGGEARGGTLRRRGARKRDRWPRARAGARGHGRVLPAARRLRARPGARDAAPSAGVVPFARRRGAERRNDSGTQAPRINRPTGTVRYRQIRSGAKAPPLQTFPLLFLLLYFLLVRFRSHLP